MSTPPVPPDRPDDDPTGVRALLSGLPDPGPMPPDVLDRINASIAAEQEARAGSAARPDGVVVPLRSRRRTWQRAALVAAAVAAVGVAVPALFSGGGSGITAQFSNHDSAGGSAGSAARSPEEAATGGTPSGFAPSGSVAPRTQTPATTDPRVGAVHGDVTLTASGTAYTAAALGSQAVALAAVARDKASATDLGRRPTGSVGGAATSPAGLRACLTALGVEGWMPVTGDVATYEGHPAVVALVSSDTGQSAYAVRPTCDATHPLKLAGPVPVP